MPRPLRNPVPGATYHVYTRGNRRAPIVEDDGDRGALLGIAGDVIRRRGWRCLAYCVMTNHYHLLVETPCGDLSAGMHDLNGRYARAFNRRHGWSGHLFERRFGSVEAQSDWHLLELCRYIVLNPVRAGVCAHPAQYPWTSYRACAGHTTPSPFLDVARLLRLFARDAGRARVTYRRFVEDGIATARAA